MSTSGPGDAGPGDAGLAEDGTTVFATPWFSIVERPSEPAWGMGAAPFLQLVTPDGIIVLPVAADGRLVLIRQYRPARGRVTLELPAGYMEPGESPEEAARRELAEETGYGGGEFLPLGSGGLSLNRETAAHHLFLARGLVPLAAGKTDGFIDLALVTMGELSALAAAGEFEQFAALGLFAMAHWKYGLPLA